jgi:hypothetical protein
MGNKMQECVGSFTIAISAWFGFEVEDGNRVLDLCSAVKMITIRKENHAIVGGLALDSFFQCSNKLMD